MPVFSQFYSNFLICFLIKKHPKKNSFHFIHSRQTIIKQVQMKITYLLFELTKESNSINSENALNHLQVYANVLCIGTFKT